MLANYRQIVFINYYGSTDETLFVISVGTENGNSFVLV